MHFVQVQVRRSVVGRDIDFNAENDGSTHLANNFKPPVIRKGKLIVVDLAGSERIHKSGALDHSTTRTSYCSNLFFHEN